MHKNWDWDKELRQKLRAWFRPIQLLVQVKRREQAIERLCEEIWRKISTRGRNWLLGAFDTTETKNDFAKGL